MNITGKLLAVNQEVSVSAKFKKREFVIETKEKYPKKICFQLVNDRVDLIDHYQVNEYIDVHFNLESRDYKGNWYTSATAWKIEKQAYNNSDEYNGDDLPY